MVPVVRSAVVRTTSGDAIDCEHTIEIVTRQRGVTAGLPDSSWANTSAGQLST